MNTLKMHVVSKGAAAPPKRLVHAMALFAAIILGLCAAFPSHAIDLVAFGGITGPLVSALTQLAALAPGGLLIYETFQVGNERYGRPSNPAFLLQPGELLQRADAAGLTAISYFSGYLAAPKPALVQRIAARAAGGS